MREHAPGVGFPGVVFGGDGGPERVDARVTRTVQPARGFRADAPDFAQRQQRGDARVAPQRLQLRELARRQNLVNLIPHRASRLTERGGQRVARHRVRAELIHVSHLEVQLPQRARDGLVVLRLVLVRPRQHGLVDVRQLEQRLDQTRVETAGRTRHVLVSSQSLRSVPRLFGRRVAAPRRRVALVRRRNRARRSNGPAAAADQKSRRRRFLAHQALLDPAEVRALLRLRVGDGQPRGRRAARRRRRRNRRARRRGSRVRRRGRRITASRLEPGGGGRAAAAAESAALRASASAVFSSAARRRSAMELPRGAPAYACSPSAARGGAARRRRSGKPRGVRARVRRLMHSTAHSGHTATTRDSFGVSSVGTRTRCPTSPPRSDSFPSDPDLVSTSRNAATSHLLSRAPFLIRRRWPSRRPARRASRRKSRGVSRARPNAGTRGDRPAAVT